MTPEEMTIEEVRKQAVELGADLTSQIRRFEDSTGCKVHSLPVTPSTNAKKQSNTTVQVRVEIDTR
jgi:hypothetical protein